MATTYNNYYVETFQGKLIKYLKFKLSIRFPETPEYIIRGIVNRYLIFLITHTEELVIGVLGLVKEDTDKQNIIDFCNSGELITEVRNNLPAYSRANPLTKAKISRSSGLVIKPFRRIVAEFEDYQAKQNTNVSRQIVDAIKNLSSIATVHLQRTQATLTVQNTNTSLSAMITSDIRTTVGSAMVSNAIAFNAKITADIVLDSTKRIVTAIAKAVVPPTKSCRNRAEGMLLLADSTKAISSRDDANMV
ncbi:MAG: hypothetical protein JSY10_29455 [Paenibacillus sp.]|nr:hypothetical protein [Paenibacillus sp.]